MKITILSVGKIKEKYWNDAIAEYGKRLGRYCSLNFVEVMDEKTPDGAAPALEAQIKEKEGMKILEKLKGLTGSGNDAFVYALAIEGRAYDSVGFANQLEKLSVMGKSHLIFIIGGSLGLSDAVLQRADGKISFSAMTFPHQMMRVILLEQIYRGYRIIHHEPYHK